MKIRTDFPHKVDLIEHCWILMSDGTRLAARIWLPVDAEQAPVPAVLEYIPYRKNDGTAQRDEIRNPYIAGHGYACVRVDMRGSGDSDGILYDEYLLQEQEDALEILRWIAEQPWCTGKIGIIGKSWGGFNGLQVAARKPPELKAIISVCSTDDRYADDVHYMGGCMLGQEMLSWASTMLAYNARPPEPKVVGEQWRAMWLERLEKTPPFVEAWLSHQTRDEFWQHGSVCENFADIECAVYAVGGWNDAYSNAVLRLLEGLPGPSKGLIGPWSHQYPESADMPGPAIGFQQECLRWWDYWLKGIDTGIMDEPALRMWMMESIVPNPSPQEWPGRWVAEAGWPAATIAPNRFYLGDTKLAPDIAVSDAQAVIKVVGVQSHGTEAGNWYASGLAGELPTDQRRDDSLSHCFTSAPLGEQIEIAGFPIVNVRLSADMPNALLIARLCDVAPDGASTLITRGMLNLTHRNGHDVPESLEPDKEYAVSVQLNAVAYALPAGHRLRLAISPTYWPHAWPSPQSTTLTLVPGSGSFLDLPVRSPKAEDAMLLPFEMAEISTPLPIEMLRPAKVERSINQNVMTGVSTLSSVVDEGRIYFPESDVEYDVVARVETEICEGAPLSAKTRCRWRIEHKRDGWQTYIETDSVMTATAEHFVVTNRLEAFEGDTPVFEKVWDFQTPRNGV